MSWVEKNRKINNRGGGGGGRLFGTREYGFVLLGKKSLPLVETHCPVNCFCLLSFRISLLKDLTIPIFFWTNVFIANCRYIRLTAIALLWGLMSKKIIEIMYDWSVLLNLFRSLTIRTTFKIDLIPCNCVWIFKTFLSNVFLIII